MKLKEFLLILISVCLSVLLGLGLIRFFAPQLLGIEVPVDLQMVQVDKKVAPFFDSVFRDEDYTFERRSYASGSEFLIPDPYILRGRPLVLESWYNGPHDILGFRNRQIPNDPDVITIGDSQTYGIIVSIEENWPSQLQQMLTAPNRAVSVYNMSIGGWGAVEYLEVFRKAVLFEPGVIIVAFYSGNDSLETYKKAYSDARWESIRTDDSLTTEDLNSVIFGEKKQWGPVIFNDGVKTTFTPVTRLYANQDHPVVRAGYEIMGNVAEEMIAIAAARKIQLVFTIIPTKELVYSVKVEADAIFQPRYYTSLVKAETENINRLSSRLAGLKNSTYIDLLSPLQEKSLSDVSLYHEEMLYDGHPGTNGNRLIAEILSSAVSLD